MSQSILCMLAAFIFIVAGGLSLQYASARAFVDAIEKRKTTALVWFIAGVIFCMSGLVFIWLGRAQVAI